MLVLYALLAASVIGGVALLVKRYHDGRTAIADRSVLCKAHHVSPCQGKAVAALVADQVKRITALETTNATTATSARTLAGRLLTALLENERVRVEGQLAVAQAEALRRDAERTLRSFTDRFASRKPTCESALLAIDAACPELEAY